MVSTHTPGPGDAAGHGGREETFPLMPILPQQIISGRLPCLHPVFKGTTPQPLPAPTTHPKSSRMRARPWLWSTLERGPGWKCCERKAGTGPFSRRHPQPSSAKAREQRPGRDGKAGQGHAECQGQGCSAWSKEHPPAVGAVRDSLCLALRGAGIKWFPPATWNSNSFCSAA